MSPTVPWSRWLQLLGLFTRRELTHQYLGSLSGMLWVILQPLALLAIYSFVFVVVLKIKLPEADTTGFVPFLAVAFWPWTAFAEALRRAAGSIEEGAALIGKVSVPQEILVAANVLAAFALNLVGYVAVLIVLAMTGTTIIWSSLAWVVLWLLMLGLFAFGLGLLLASIQVFIRDLGHALGPILTFWFFATPILYSPALVPSQYQPWLDWNPMHACVSALRGLLLTGDWEPGRADLWFAVCTALALVLGMLVFRRLSPRFEDFL